MTSAPSKRGGAPVGFITELDGIEAASVICLRRDEGLIDYVDAAYGGSSDENAFAALNVGLVPI
jgi:hypothetical protein